MWAGKSFLKQAPITFLRDCKFFFGTDIRRAVSQWDFFSYLKSLHIHFHSYRASSPSILLFSFLLVSLFLSHFTCFLLALNFSNKTIRLKWMCKTSLLVIVSLAWIFIFWKSAASLFPCDVVYAHTCSILSDFCQSASFCVYLVYNVFYVVS